MIDVCVFFFFKQKTAYEMRISDWSSDVCSSDLGGMVNSGANAAYFGPVGATASISQVLNTVVGQSYDVSFYLQNSGAGTNSFDVFFGGGAAPISYVDALAMPWTRLSFTGTAVSDLSTLVFRFRPDTSF